jgi:opacity protein-like surface antigen
MATLRRKDEDRKKSQCFAEDQWLLLAMARAGFTPVPSFLVYAMAGVAVAGITTNLEPAGVTSTFRRSSVVHDGWALGFGFEYQWQLGICCRRHVEQMAGSTTTLRVRRSALAAFSIS